MLGVQGRAKQLPDLANVLEKSDSINNYLRKVSSMKRFLLGSYSNLSLSVAIVAASLVSLGGSASKAIAAPAHPAMHHALFELQEAKSELRNAKRDFGGHRAKALEACDAAAKQLEISLESKGDAYKGLKGRDVGLYKKYNGAHPHINHAIVELREAAVEMRAAKHDFGGHRVQALRDVEFAIEQLELAVKFARK